ncbi:MAG: hypothetical protein LBD25_05900 [Coriobacteriales bacterium]|nr:hypothetical protein [Coriobacteriales bacterium]
MVVNAKTRPQPSSEQVEFHESLLKDRIKFIMNKDNNDDIISCQYKRVSLPIRYKFAAIVMIIHGGVMELGSSLAMLPLLASGNADAASHFSFIVPYLQENMPLMLVMGCIFGIVRLTGAVALLKNRMWGLVLSLINCAITMALMIFMLPAGIADGILACLALILMLVEHFADKKIIE